MVTDGLNPLTVLLFVGAVLGGGALAATYLFARFTKRVRALDMPLSPNTRYVALVDAEGGGTRDRPTDCDGA